MEIASWAKFFEIIGQLMVSGYTPLFVFGIAGVAFMLSVLANFFDWEVEETFQAFCGRTVIWGCVFSAIWATYRWILN